MSQPARRLLRPLSSSEGDGSLEGVEPNPAPPPSSCDTAQHATPTTATTTTEASAFAEHINAELGEDPHVAHLGLPLDPTDPGALFQACADGIIFCKLINLASPGTIDERAVNVPKREGASLSFYHKIENNNLAINAARALGCVVTNVGAQDLMEGRSSLVLGLLWQVIKVQLLASVSLRETPELVRLLDQDEDLESFLCLPPETILLRWLNFHLAAAGVDSTVSNFGSDLEDGAAYLLLLHQLDPLACPLPHDWTEWPALDRARHAIKAAAALGVPSFLQPTDVVRGNRTLNLGFCAHLFNRCPGLEAVTEEDFVGYDFSALELEEISASGGGISSREESTLRMWINSLGLRDAQNEPLFVRNLFSEEMSDATVLLRAMEAIEPGCVPWKRVNQPARNRYKQIENANLAIQVARDMGLVLVNVGGPDLVDREKKFLLAIVGQIMRRYTLGLLRRLGAGGSEAVTEEEVLAWANATVAQANSGHSGPCSSFRDPTLADGRFLLALIAAIEPRAVDWELVTDGGDELDRLANAKYAVSLARRLGACIFLAPEDILEVKARAIMLFLAALWACSLERARQQQATAAPAKRSSTNKAKLVPLAATPSTHGSETAAAATSPHIPVASVGGESTASSSSSSSSSEGIAAGEREG